MTTAQVVEMSVTVNNNSAIQDYVHPDDQTQPTFDIFDYHDLYVGLQSFVIDEMKQNEAKLWI